MPKREDAFRAYDAIKGPLSERDHEMFVAGWQALIDMLDGRGHIARVHEFDFTLQHPIVERLEGNLLECEMQKLVHVACVEGHLTPGDYRVWIDRSVLQWEEISPWEKPSTPGAS